MKRSRPDTTDKDNAPPQEQENVRLQFKELPEPNRKGIINYFGYMDDYFQGSPPIASRNWVIDNKKLEILADLTGDF
jgi:hypothetical protein